ncbi:hypothetical protein J2Z22_001129 [Paenibacillus forsythiae]|uniref:Uncharacterized protein n=1 Tax=Paenibacillus forsythiae TaxID=365616 RepID=A0ABU3H7D3_9BACL|nr:hypothetical protein [Paenibacillus forsythiae]
MDGAKVKLSEALHAQVIADGEGRIYITRD